MATLCICHNACFFLVSLFFFIEVAFYDLIKKTLGIIPSPVLVLLFFSFLFLWVIHILISGQFSLSVFNISAACTASILFLLYNVDSYMSEVKRKENGILKFATQAIILHASNIHVRQCQVTLFFCLYC